MTKVITFSRQFPKGHPRQGQETYFVEKLLLGFPEMEQTQDVFGTLVLKGLEFMNELQPKYHTIRGGKRFKEGEYFSPRVWIGKPYRSKQFAFSPDIKIVKTIDIGLRIRGNTKEFYCNDVDLTPTSLALIAKNDGLELDDFINWFTRPFDGQIICWKDCGY